MDAQNRQTAVGGEAEGGIGQNKVKGLAKEHMGEPKKPWNLYIKNCIFSLT